MSKATVTRFFIGGMLAVLAGAMLGVATVWIAIANDVFVMNGPDVVGLQWSALTWSLLAVGIVAASAMVGGMLAGLAGLDRCARQHGRAPAQDVVRRPAPGRHLQPRVHRHDRVRHRRPGRDGRHSDPAHPGRGDRDDRMTHPGFDGDQGARDHG